MLRALFLDDDSLFGSHVAKHLARRHIRVELASSVDAGLARALRGGFDAALLDWNFPQGDGCSLCLALRDGGVRQPLLMFTHREEEADIIAALSCGADEFVSKAVSFDVLAAKLRAHVRRGPWRSPCTQVGCVLVDDAAGAAYVDGMALLDLTPLEFKLLSLLAERHGQPVDRDEVLRRMWGGGPTRSGSGAAHAHDQAPQEAGPDRGPAAPGACH